MVIFIPCVLPTSFLEDVTVTITVRKSSSVGPASLTAIVPSSEGATISFENPPGMLRLADADPRRAILESSEAESESPNAAHPATVSAAKPLADDANPTAAGKVFLDSTRARLLDPAIVLIKSRCPNTLGSFDGAPSKEKESCAN